jgi:hypothetical protein
VHYRIVPAIATPVILAIAGFSHPPALQGQAASSPGPLSVATRLGALTRERAARWAAAAPAIHCSPAPLTERPGVAAEFARRPVAPLEEAFHDAAIVTRTYAASAEPLTRRGR